MKKVSLIAILALVLIVAACGGNGASNNTPATPNQPEQNNTNTNGNEPAKPEEEEPVTGKITVYVAFHEDHAVAALKKFTEETGIEADMIRMASGEILAKVRAEQNNPQADVWYGGPAETHVAAMQENLLQPYKSPVAEAIPQEFRDPDGYWTGVYIGPIGFASNKEFLDKHNLQPPSSWDDLLDPAYKGEVVMAHPGSSGTAYTILYSIIKAKGGDEAGFQFMEKLHPQIQQYTTSGGAGGRMAGMGEAAVGILFAHDIIKYQKEGFDNLVMSSPSDGTGLEIGGVGIINNAPNLAGAKKFIDWASGPSAQEVGQTKDSFQILTHPDAQQPKEAIDLSQLNLVEMSPAEAGARRQEIIDRWDREINK